METRKIQEWHLDPELLQKLMSGGTELTFALRDYVKKTDTIEKEQLGQSCFADIAEELQSIRSNYRSNNTLISQDDLDAELQGLLNTLETMGETSGYTQAEIETIIQSYFEENGVVDTRIEGKIPSITQDVIAEVQTVLDAVTLKANTVDEEVTALAQTVANNKTLADTLYRSKNDKITAEDLDTEITNTLQNLNDNIENVREEVNALSEGTSDENTLSIGGSKNQIVVLNDAGGVEAADIIEQIDIATTSEELSTARGQLKTPILSFVTPQAIHRINLPEWNARASRISEEENIPVPPVPEPVYYNVHYAYISSDENINIPQIVSDTLPVDEADYESGNEIVPLMPSETLITESAGIWTFAGWDAEIATFIDTDITFTGTWEFEAYVPPATYTVYYRYYDNDFNNPISIPNVVLDTLPQTEPGKNSGYYAIPKNPYQDYIFDGDTLWHFEGWNNESITIEDSDITFEGAWSHINIEPGNTEYDIYRHTYKVRYVYSDTLPEDIQATLPAEVKGNLDGTIIIPEEPSSTSIQIANRIWTFHGWDEEEKTIDGADITFTGTWVYTDLPYYTVYYEYDGELPAAVMATKPANEPDKLSGANISPVSPSALEVAVEGGKWIFADWDKTSVIINDADVTFTGTWIFEETPEEPEDPGEEAPVYESSTYTDYVLTAEQIQTEGISITVNENTISGTNASLIDTATICVGFYGTRIKLYTSLDTEEQSITVSIDNKKTTTIALLSSDQFEEDQGHFCFFCMENLSEGLHRICISVPPGETFKIDNKVSIDDGDHAGILLAADIPDTTFYDEILFDTGDYLDLTTMSGSYAFTPSDDVEEITASSYASVDFEDGNSGYERRLLYSPLNEKLYYLTENGILVLLSQNYNDRLAALEARITALEG